MTEDEEAAVAIIRGCTPPESPIEPPPDEEKSLLIAEALAVADAVELGTLEPEIEWLQALAISVQNRWWAVWNGALSQICPSRPYELQ